MRKSLASYMKWVNKHNYMPCFRLEPNPSTDNGDTYILKIKEIKLLETLVTCSVFIGLEKIRDIFLLFHISKNKNITTLYISRPDFNLSDFKLISRMKQLQRLIISYDEQPISLFGNDYYINYIYRLKYLTHLEISTVPIEHMQKLLKHNSLCHLKIDNGYTDIIYNSYRKQLDPLLKNYIYDTKKLEHSVCETKPILRTSPTVYIIMLIGSIMNATTLKKLYYYNEPTVNIGVCSVINAGLGAMFGIILCSKLRFNHRLIGGCLGAVLGSCLGLVLGIFLDTLLGTMISVVTFDIILLSICEFVAICFIGAYHIWNVERYEPLSWYYITDTINYPKSVGKIVKPIGLNQDIYRYAICKYV